jgi:hypothetical protein
MSLSGTFETLSLDLVRGFLCPLMHDEEILGNSDNSDKMILNYR